MPETPDFEKLAGQAISGSDFHIRRVAEQLRLVWNARGAADLATVRTKLLGACPDARHDDPDNSGQCIKCGVVLDYMEPGERAEQLDRALRELDR